MKRSSREGRSADIRLVYRRLFRRGARAAEEESPPLIDEAPAPAVTTARPARPRRALARAVTRVSRPPPPAEPPTPAPREWNLWDLERRAREQAGTAPRNEEWSALFTNLRVFANADGVLPKEFDGLVRESFGRLIEPA